MPTPLQNSVQGALQVFVANENEKEEHDAIDVLRTFQQEASLMYETLALKALIRQDPFVHLEDAQPQVKRLCSHLRVTDCQRVVTKLGYSYIDAVVTIPVAAAETGSTTTTADTAASNNNDDHLKLSFQYERRRLSDDNGGTTVTYSIDMSRNHGPNERLLWVQVFAMGSAPSHLPAKSLDEEEDDEEGEDGWDDMDEDGTNEQMNESKSELPNEDADDGGDADADSKGFDALVGDCDRYVAHMDPDVLGRFLEWSGLGPINEATAFFLLMTFPFYEHEWDLVGFILDSVFGFNDEDGGDDEDEQDMDDDL
jgi:hypothetical protein